MTFGKRLGNDLYALARLAGSDYPMDTKFLTLSNPRLF